MREAVIPPPMSAYEIHFESQEGVNTCSEIIVLILRYYIFAYMDPEARKLCLSAYTLHWSLQKKHEKFSSWELLF